MIRRGIPFAPIGPALLAGGLLLTGAAPAQAGALDGGVIDAVDWSAASYRPGETPDMMVRLRAAGGFDGTIVTALSDGRGISLPSPPPQSVVVAPGAEAAIHVRFAVPPANWRGYHVSIEARNRSGRLVDDASGAFDIATDWKRFPRYCFMTGNSVVAGQPVELMLQDLVSYRCNAVQWYDVNWKQHLPYSPAASWPNVANQLIDRRTLSAGLAAARRLRLASFDYALWNGAWPGYETNGSGARLSWGVFRHACAPHCTEADQVSHGPFPPGWAAPKLLQMDSSNPAWQAFWRTQEGKVLERLGYDGVQIDTLGDPGPVTNQDGHPVNLGAALVPFTNAAASSLNRRVILNPVSRWNLDDVLRHGAGDVVYTEIHPEFGDTPFFPALNGLAARIHAGTRRNAVVAAYLEAGYARQPGCHTTGGSRTCFFNAPGVRYLDSQMLASGLDHWELGDRNAACPVRQAKLASNIYVPGPALCMDAALQEWEQDNRNFEVSYETLLRDRVVDAPDLVVATDASSGATFSTDGAAGSVYVLPKRRPGFTILHLLNFSALRSIRLDDDMGTAAPPRVFNRLPVVLQVPRQFRNGRLWWASPDLRHGMAQPLRYARAGDQIRFTIPRLEGWDMIVLETTAASQLSRP